MLSYRPFVSLIEDGFKWGFRLVGSPGNLCIIEPAIMITLKNWLVDYGSILISINNAQASALICSNLFFMKYTGLFLNLSVLGIS